MNRIRITLIKVGDSKVRVFRREKQNISLVFSSDKGKIPSANKKEGLCR